MRLNINQIRIALREISVPEAEGMNDLELKRADFLQDLGMDEQSIYSLTSLLERKYNIRIPAKVMTSLHAKNTVNVFITAANQFLIDLL